MTDITELAQSKSLRKKLNRRLNDAYGFQRTSGGKHTTISLNIAECKSVIAALEKHLALVEALEYYKSREERVTSLVRDNSKSWDELYRQVEAKGKRNVELVEALESEKRICATWRKTAEANSEKLEKAQQQMTESENRVRKQNRHICELFDDNTALRQRIAGLEARTVKLPDLRQIVSGDRYVWSDGVYNYSQDVKVALAAAGIKVEVE
ncbi:ead/Ea22-like family protein [Klebsiella quasipneumoniae]|uniref:ead/Ea22-like family protein n=1 Tax=Klebsiella quasipneumoniae TaxID=1463165 RepID=UPI0021CF45FA|nr:ead/Ea22-like family protein [Klebsiella quasipneumoniae]MCU6520489.1 ead/Ea22-like family protein [Klebsiella quasipneumoniae]